MSDRLSRVFAFVLTLLLPAAVSAQDRFQFNIPRGELKAAISEFEKTTGVRVTVTDHTDLAGFISPGLTGEADPKSALETLVKGTGLAVKAVPGGLALRIAVDPFKVEVHGALTPYRPVDTASATRTLTPLRDVPQTINVIPSEILKDQRAQSVGDAMRNVTGITVAQGEGNRDQLVIRGTSTNSDFFVNGIRDDQERFRDLYNVQRVEVVQGPAAVLYGRGGGGGLVNFVTQQPLTSLGSEASVEFGSYGHKRATLQFGHKVGANAIFRVAAVGQDSDGFRDGFFLRRYGVNPTFGFTVGPRTTVTLGAEHFNDHRFADRGIPSRNGRPVDVPASQLFGSRSQNDSQNDVDSARAAIEHRISPSLLIRNNFQAAKYHKAYANVYAGTGVSAAGTLSLSAYDHAIDRTNVFNQTDVVWDASLFGLRHTVLGGIEAGRQNQDELRHQAAAIANVPLTATDRDANFATAPVSVDRDAIGTVFAGYVQDQLSVIRGVKAVVGARVDRFTVTVDDHLPNTIDLSRTDVAVSPRAGVVVQPSSAVSLYASYTYTFLPSGQTLGLARNTAEVGPENATNYETGAKLDLLERRLSVSAALFRLDRNNVKNTDPLDPTKLVLTGQQRTDGVQFSAAGNLSPRWKLMGGYANLSAKVLKDTSSAPAGRRVGLVPRNQANIWTTYDITPRLTAGGGIIHQSDMFTSFSNQVTLPAFTRTDAMAAYRIGRYRVAVNVENLFDQRYFATAHSDNNISPGAPRNARVSVSAAF